MAVVLLALRLAVGFLAEPMGDEAYYWVWGQRPGWSYYDHPPLQAWVQGVTTAVLGPSLFALRLPSLLAFGGTLWVLALFMRRQSGPDWRAGVLVGLVVLLGSPLFMIYTTVVTPDYLLVMLSLSAVYLMARFLETADGGSPRWRYYFSAAVAVGLACLTKYIGAVLLVGFGLVVLLTPRHRRLLLDWRSYAGVALVVALQAPVLIWNLQTNFASFRLHLVDRQQLGFGLTWTHLLSFLLQLLVLVGPFLIWPIIGVLRSRPDGFAGRSAALGKATFGASTVGFSLVALGNFVSGHWNIIGQLALLPSLVRQIRRGWQLGAHWLYGAAMGTLLLVNYTSYPVLGVDTLETYRGYGWSEVAVAYREEADRLQPGFEAASHYQLASQLNYAMRSTAVTALSQRLDQYDYWFDDAGHVGQSALILDDTHAPLEEAVAKTFERVEEVRRVEIVRQGVLINTYRIYLGTGYRGSGDVVQRYQF
jgi:hypothetical protein